MRLVYLEKKDKECSYDHILIDNYTDKDLTEVKRKHFTTPKGEPGLKPGGGGDRSPLNGHHLPVREGPKKPGEVKRTKKNTREAEK